jgi:MFS family permease
MLALVLCLPAALVLSLLTPLAIKLGLPDLSKTGRVAGMVFALSTLGCLLGNYLTGFVLIPLFTINTLVLAAAGALAALSVGALVVLGRRSPPADSAQTQLDGHVEQFPGEVASVPQAPPGPLASESMNPHAFPDIRLAFTIVFLASFGGMTLELTASRVLAQFLGVSLFTWTGIIGVMLAGTALGNLLGGWMADRVNRVGSSLNPRLFLAGTLLLAGAVTVFQFVTMALVSQYGIFDELDPITQVMGWTFSLFFLPMFALGMVSPQVIRLAVPDVAHVGLVAGRVYAWSTFGAIVGTFVAGYLLLSLIGMKMTILCISLVLVLTSLLVAKVWECNPLLYLFSIVLGGITGGAILVSRPNLNNDSLIAQLETNYYTIKVTRWDGEPDILMLTLDHLIHSEVKPNDPFFLHYKHEHIQMEFLWAARNEHPQPRVLVVGGGGYTFPRYAMEIMPEARMDVVEIDPGVTAVAKKSLGLKDYEGLTIHHMDGRQYVSEKVPPGTYDLVAQDAVNDLSVPSHLLTKEYNDAVKATLKPNGVYLLTVIDSVGYGQLWKAAMHTLQQSYPPENIALLASDTVNPTVFRLSDETFKSLRRLRYPVPESVLMKLEPMKYQSYNWDEFLEKLAELLDSDDAKQYRETIITAVDFTRFRITDEALATLRNLQVPESILKKLAVSKNKKFAREEFVGQLREILDSRERKEYQQLLMDHTVDFAERQVYVIYASDRPLDIASLRNAVTAQVAPGFRAVIGTRAERQIEAEIKRGLCRTHQVPPVDLQPYLEAGPRIILTDQYAPVDNLMADVFRYRYRKRQNE